MADPIPFGGETFTVPEGVGLMPLMRFAKAAQSKADTNSLAGLTAMYDLLENCLDPDEWERFQEVATATRATGDDLMAFVGVVLTAATERPTQRPSDSSDGPQPITPRSTGDSSQQAMRLLDGRPDLQLMVVMAQEHQAS